MKPHNADTDEIILPIGEILLLLTKELNKKLYFVKQKNKDMSNCGVDKPKGVTTLLW